MQSFTLADARIDGALLTGTQVYANGRREKLEGVFVNRTVHNSPTDTGTTEFGLGIAGRTIQIHGITVTRFFLRPKA
jgi:hypothetical protein